MKAQVQALLSQQQAFMTQEIDKVIKSNLSKEVDELKQLIINQSKQGHAKEELDDENAPYDSSVIPSRFSKL